MNVRGSFISVPVSPKPFPPPTLRLPVVNEPRFLHFAVKATATCLSCPTPPRQRTSSEGNPAGDSEEFRVHLAEGDGDARGGHRRDRVLRL